MFLTCLPMVLPNAHATLDAFRRKNVTFPFCFATNNIASGTRTIQRVNHAPLGESSRAHFPVSSHSTYSLRHLNLRIVEIIQCVPCTYKQLAGCAISTRTTASSRDTLRMQLPSSSPLPLCLLAWSPSHPCAPPSLYASPSGSLCE